MTDDIKKLDLLTREFTKFYYKSMDSNKTYVVLWTYIIHQIALLFGNQKNGIVMLRKIGREGGCDLISVLESKTFWELVHFYEALRPFVIFQHSPSEIKAEAIVTEEKHNFPNLVSETESRKNRISDLWLEIRGFLQRNETLLKNQNMYQEQRNQFIQFVSMMLTEPVIEKIKSTFYADVTLFDNVNLHELEETLQNQRIFFNLQSTALEKRN